MAMGVFLFAFSVLFGVLMATTKVNVENIKDIQANMIAERELGLIQKFSYKDIEAGGTTGIQQDPDFAGLFFEVVALKAIEENELVPYELRVYLKSDPADPTKVKDPEKPDKVYTLLVSTKE